MKISRILGLLLVVVILANCRKPYNPPVVTTNANYLVVEGMINTGADSTIIKISRTMLIGKETKANPERNLTVRVEGESNDTYALVEKTPGNYVSPNLGLDPSKRYRLRISTAGSQKVYLSDFVQSKVTPPIDDVTWEVKSDGLQIYVDTKDPSNNSRYYRWEYHETWEFHVAFQSIYKYKAGQIVDRENGESLYECWAGTPSSDIVIGSSAKLTDDVISKQPLIFHHPGSEKISKYYSVLVKQYAITREAFEFWENLRKNTETVGSIFDAQPSQITGNVKNTKDEDEPVIGYISAGTMQTKRIYIKKSELPDWTADHVTACELRLQDVITKFNYEAFAKGDIIPTFPYVNDEGEFIGYYGGTRFCADCTSRGTKTKPPFWP